MMKALVSKALRLTTLSIISKMRGETTTTLCFPLFHTLKPHVPEHQMPSSGHLFESNLKKLSQKWGWPSFHDTTVYSDSFVKNCSLQSLDVHSDLFHQSFSGIVTMQGGPIFMQFCSQIKFLPRPKLL